MKSKDWLLNIIIALACLVPIVSCSSKSTQGYGVFLGINGGQMDRLKDYNLIVIDPSEFEAEQIKELQDEGKTVYGYINIGAIENYRPYYDRFKNLSLGLYENWPDEEWLDVSSNQWQDFIVNELGKDYVDKGLDGFFLDNADVYYHYPTDDIFEGLCQILSGLKAYKLPLIINGGDVFVTKCIKQDTSSSLFDGVNQEAVFTSIDFEKRSSGIQAEKERDYFQGYLEKVKQADLAVYLLEYGADPTLAREIDEYCQKNGFRWYNADDLELK